MITEILRIIFRGMLTLFIPGYAMTLALFKDGEIDEIERIALSFTFSIATIPLILYYLNLTFKIGITLINLIIIDLLIVTISLVVRAYKNKQSEKN